jgi:ABC-type transport system involved in cytochrome bd biosynthesis fused ATPase/permease subunit
MHAVPTCAGEALKPIIPDAALGQHIAVLGKTGSGKAIKASEDLFDG